MITEPLRSLAVAIDGLNFDPANARKHGDKNLDAIKSSLAKFGQRKPIVVQREGMIVRAGNGTLAAAKALGWKEIAAVILDDDNATAAQFAIADNRTAELAEWDNETLALLLDGWDKETQEAVGFDKDDIEAVLSELEPDEIVEDEVPEPPVDPVTKPGNLWILGEHRLLCGDSTNAEDVARLMGGEEINVAFTSPPYASQRKYDESSGFEPVHPDAYVGWFKAVQAGVASHIASDGSWFVNIKEHCEDGQRSLYVKDLVISHVREWGWRFVDEFVWVNSGVPKEPVGRFKNQHEPIFWFSKAHAPKFLPDGVMVESERAFSKAGRGKASAVQGHGDSLEGVELSSGMAYPGNALKVSYDRGRTGHPAVFPVGLPTFFVKAYSDHGDNVYDPFLGSGTTLIAAEQLGRKCYGMEISPQYCDVIVKRWENLTGKKAVLAGG